MDDTGIPTWEESEPISMSEESKSVPTWEESEPIPTWKEIEPPGGGFFGPKRSDWNRMRAMFSGEDPYAAAASPKNRQFLEGSVSLMPDPDAELRKIAVTAYMSRMKRENVSFVYDNLDKILETYYGKKTSVDEAFKDIGEMLGNRKEKANLFSRTISGLGAGTELVPKTIFGMLSFLGKAMQAQNQADLLGRGIDPDRYLKSPEEVEKQVLDFYQEYYGKNAEWLREDMQVPDDWMTNSDSFRDWCGNAAVSLLAYLPELGVQTGVGAAGGLPVLGMMFGQNKYMDLGFSNPGMEEGKRVLNAAGTGLVNSAFEKITFGILEGKITKQWAKQGIKAGLKRAAGYFGWSMTKEAAEEMSEQISENLIDIYTGVYGDHREFTPQDWGEHLLRGVPESGFLGGVTGGGMAYAPYRSYRAADSAVHNARNMLMEQEQTLLQKEILTDPETEELTHIQTLLESGDSRNILKAAESIANANVLREAIRKAEEASRRKKEEAEMTDDDEAKRYQESYRLRKEELCHNPEETADEVFRMAEIFPDIKFQTVDGPEGFSPEVLAEAKKMDVDPRSIRAWYNQSRNSVWVNTRRVRASEVPYLMLHEIATHKGIPAILGDNYDPVMDALFQQYRPQIEEINRRYHFDLETVAGQRLATEEYLADRAEFCGHDWQSYDEAHREDVDRYILEHGMPRGNRKEAVRSLMKETGELELRPSWWREFLQKVKMFLRSRRGFEDYRFTDREIETLLLRGFRKTGGKRSPFRGTGRTESDGGIRFADARDVRFALFDNPEKRDSVLGALAKIADGSEEETIPNLRNDLEQYGGTNDITLPWGNLKKGIYHIAYRRGTETLLHVVDALADGKIERYVAGNKTIHLVKDGYEAILCLDENGGKKSWLLTGWEINKPDAFGKFYTKSEATQTAPTFSRRDLGAGLKQIRTNESRSDSNISPFGEKSNGEDVKFSVSPVYTGSAADYESPSLQYIGTGEGAQVYGWGLYGSSSEKVARWYARTDAERKNRARILLDGKEFDPEQQDKADHSGEPTEFEIANSVLDDVLRRKGSISGTLEYYRLQMGKTETIRDNPEFYRLCREWLEKNRDRIQYIPENEDLSGRRNLYRQTFFPGKEENLLDWDKPVPEDQRRKIEEQLKEEGFYVEGDPDEASAEYRELKKRKNAGEDIPEKMLDEAYEKAERLHAQRNVTGPTVNGDIPSGSMVYENLEDIVGEPKAVSEFLSRAGIDGVTYIGGSSGVRNYVAFSDKDIRVDEHIRFSLQDEPDMAEYSLETAAASKAGYRVERVNENAGREFNAAKGVIVQPEMIYKRGEVPKEQPRTWLRNRCMEYVQTHHILGEHDAPALGDGVKVTVGSVKAVLNHPGSDIKNNLIAVIPDLLKDAVLIQMESNGKSKTYLLAAKVRYGENDRFIAGMVIHENQGKFYYDHELVEIENADIQSSLPMSATGVGFESASVINVIQNALFASGFEKKDGRNIRFSLNQYSDADWRDMVGYMKAKVGTLLTKPDADYRRILEEAGMECFSDADAHAIAAEAMEENRKDAHAAGRRLRDKWIYENELTLRQVIDFTGSDDFKLVPDQWDGEKFTGTWIAPEYVKYSEKRPQGKMESDRSYKRYLNRREKKLKSAKGYRIDEVAEAIARKTGGDPETIQKQLVDYFRDLKKPDLYHKYAEFRKQSELSNRELRNNLREEWEELQYSRAEDAVIELLENGREITRGWIRVNRLAYQILYEQVFGKEAPRNPGKKDFEDLNAALRQKKGDMATFAAGLKEGRRILSEEYLKKLSDFKAKVCNDWNDIRELQYEAKKFAYEHVEKGFRERFISGIIGLSKYTSKISIAYPEGRRRHEFDRLCEEMKEYQRGLLKDKALRGIQDLLKRNRAKRTDKNVAFSPMGERQRALDRINQIVRMNPETAAGCMEYALERKARAEEQKDRLGDPDEESSPERDAAVLESAQAEREIFYLNHFGGLKLKEPEFVQESYQLLKDFVKAGRFEYQKQIEQRREELERKRADAIREMAAGNEEVPSGRDLDRSVNPVENYVFQNESITRLFDVLSRTPDWISLDKGHAGRMIRLIEDSTRREEERLDRMQKWFDTTLKERCGVQGLVSKGRFLNGAMKEETATVDGNPVKLIQYGTLLGEKDNQVAHWDMGRPRRRAWMHVEHCRKMLEDLNSGMDIRSYLKIDDLKTSKDVRSGLHELKIGTGRFYSVCRTGTGFRIYTEGKDGLTTGTDLKKENAPPALTVLLKDEKNLLPVSDIMRYGAEQQLLEYDAGADERIYKGLGDEVDESAWRAFQDGEGRERRIELMSPGENVVKKEEALKLSPGAAMELILLWEQDHYRPGMEWNGYTEEVIGQLKKWLDSKNPGYLKFAYAMRDFLVEERAELDEAVFKRYGVHLPEMKNFFYGDFSGSVGNRISDPGFGNPSGGMTVNATFLTARRFHLVAPDTHSNAISLFMRKQLEQNHFICWTETLRELRGIYGNRSVQNVMVKEFGQAMWNNLREKIENLASNGSAPDKAAKYLAHFYKSWAPGNVAINTSSVIKQIAGGSSYGLYVPTHKLLQYLPEANHLNRDYRTWLKDPRVVRFVANRMSGGMDPNLAGLLNYTRRGGSVSTLNDAGLKKLLSPQLYTDRLAVTTFGYAAYRHFYEQGRKRGMTLGEAEEYAIRMWQRATDETQQSGALKDQNHFTSNPGVWRYLTTFMTNPMQTASLELTAWQKFLKDRNRKNFGSLVNRIIMNHLVNTTLMNLVGSALRHGLNIGDYLEDWDDYAAGWLLGSFDALWLFGKGAMMLIGGLAGDRYASDMSAVPLLSDLARDGRTMVKIANGEEVDILDWMKISGDALMSAGPGSTRLAGILLYALARQGKRWKRLIEGRMTR